jgi:acyl-coenzyme A thioesterase PaaI-like protein
MALIWSARAKRDLKDIGTYRGRTSQVWEIRIYDEEHILICAARCTLAVVAVE